MRNRLRVVSVALCGLALLAAPPAVAVESTVDEIVEMLSAGIGGPVVLDWLDASGRALEPLTPSDLVALKKAGASDPLLRDLIERSKAEPAASPDPPEPSPARDYGRAERVVVTPAPAAPVPNETPVSVPPASPGATDETVLVRFRLAYDPIDEDDEDPWGLYVYLDGEPLSYVPASAIRGPLGAGDGGIDFRLRLPAGRHAVRVTLERHERKRKGWRHAARVYAEALDFELRAGADAEVELTFKETLLDFTDPLTFRVRQEERVVERERIGGDPDEWPELCEDLGARDPAREECLSWSELWASEGPTLDEIREAMARFDYRPIPKGA